MTGGPTCGWSGAESGRRKTVSCRGQDESYAAGIATEVPVSPAWLSHHHHADLFSNVEHNRRMADSSPGVRVDGPVGPQAKEET